MLDTRGYLDTHNADGVQTPPASESESWNRWSFEAVENREYAQACVSEAYGLMGAEWQASAILSCGHASVAYGPSGKLCRSKKTGVPTAIVQKCGTAGCPNCVRDASARNQRSIAERLALLESRWSSSGPVWQRPARLVVVRQALSSDPRLARGGGGVVAELEQWGINRMPWKAWTFDDDGRPLLPLDSDDVPPVTFRPPVVRKVQRDLFLTLAPKDRAAPGRFVRIDPMTLRDPVVKLVVGRRQRRPKAGSDGVAALVDVDGGDGRRSTRALRGPRVHRRSRRGKIRRTGECFRIGPPPSWDDYGSRFITLDHPDRPVTEEGCADAMARFADALDRLTRSPVWLAHVDASVIHLEATFSTPATRKKAAAELRAVGDVEGARELMTRPTGSWWHVHAHAVVWGRFWTQKPANRANVALAGGGVLEQRAACAKGCRCAGCMGVDDEDTLLMCWRRALISTGRYGPELAKAKVELDEGRVRRDLRKLSHPANGRRWAHALVDVRIGGARIETPRRHAEAHGAEKALREVVKYATKPVALARLPVERIAEYLDATRHRRMLRCTGLLFGVHVVEGDRKATEDGEGMDVGWHVDERGRRRRVPTAVDGDGATVTFQAMRFVDTAEAREERRQVLYDLEESHRARRRAERAARKKEAPS